MKWNAIFILIMAFALASNVAGQTKKVDDRALPDQLRETEVQNILKETNPKSHVEAALKVSDARLATALKSAQANQYKAAVEDVDVYASLIIYADGYTRKLPDAQVKDRNNCLKKIEQAIFKQTHNLNAVMREMPFDLREPVEGKINDLKKIRLRALNDAIGGGKIINSSNQK
jgi:uncharacterized hydantoinase/oxoprolinase family protein